MAGEPNPDRGGLAMSAGKGRRDRYPAAEPAAKKRQIINELEGRMNRGDLSSPVRLSPRPSGTGADSSSGPPSRGEERSPQASMSASHPVIRRWFLLLGLALALLLGVAAAATTVAEL